MDKIKNIDLGLLLLRLAFGGFMVLGHGWPKLLKFLGERPIKFADPIGLGPEISLGLAVFAEFFCALLVVVGLWTRWALIPLIFTMMVAFLVVHIDDPFKNQEKALLYLFPYVSLLFMGAGKYALDEILFNKKS